MAAVSHNVEHTAPSSTFPDKIDSVKFITKIKATNEKNSMMIIIFSNFAMVGYMNILILKILKNFESYIAKL